MGEISAQTPPEPGEKIIPRIIQDEMKEELLRSVSTGGLSQMGRSSIPYQ